MVEDGNNEVVRKDIRVGLVVRRRGLGLWGRSEPFCGVGVF